MNPTSASATIYPPASVSSLAGAAGMECGAGSDLRTISNLPSVEIAQVQFLSVHSIREAVENASIYNGFTTANEDDRQLLDGIRERGIMDPLKVSIDGYLLSGHRRLAVARLLEMDEVPVIVTDDRFGDLSGQQRIALLVAYNRTREKTFDERVAETLAQTDAYDAEAAVLSYRAERSAVQAPSNVEMGGFRRRADITTLEFLMAVQKIVEDARPNWPISNRAIHYRLLNDPPLTHDSKPGSVYKNMRRTKKNPTDYPQKLSSLLTRARIAGQIPMEAICDDERPVESWNVYDHAGSFVADEYKGFLRGYYRDLLQSQPHQIEIVVEKKTAFAATKNVAQYYTIPVTAGKGFASLPPRYEMAKRYWASKKEKLIVIFLTDFDPDGEQIAASFARSMRDDFGIERVVPFKASLTDEQVKEFDLPSSLEAKDTSPNYRHFVERHGTRAVELEALPDDLFASLLKDAIHSVLDTDAFNHEVDKERDELSELDARRRVVMDLLRRGES